MKRARTDGKNTQKNCKKKKDLDELDNDDGEVSHLEPDVLECEVNWVLGSTAVNKVSG